MFFSKEAKKAFVFPPKTGTISARHFLGSIGWHGKTPVHKKTADLLEEYPALNDYQLFGFYRDPVKRFESAILHLKQIPHHPDDRVENLLNGVSIENAPYEIFTNEKFLNSFGGFFAPQVDWLNNPKVTPLDFDNFESELRRITGNTTQPLGRRNANTDFGRQEITDNVRTFVREYYAADYAFAKERFGKTYEG